MACERHIGFQPAGSRPVSPNEGRLCPLADGEARASSNAREEIEEEAAAIPAVRPQAVPAGPSEKERLEHLPLHEPYRSWCATCVPGRAVSDLAATSGRGIGNRWTGLWLPGAER